MFGSTHGVELLSTGSKNSKVLWKTYNDRQVFNVHRFLLSALSVYTYCLKHVCFLLQFGAIFSLCSYLYSLFFCLQSDVDISD